MRIAYVVSRFPDPSETFVLRELNAIDRRDGAELELFSLFPPKHRFVQPDAERWMSRVRYTAAPAVAGALLWWLLRRPVTLLRALGSVLRGYAPKPRRLVRSLVAVAVGAAHARTMRELRVEHVHAHFATYPGLAAWLAGRLLGVPYSFTAHAHDIYIDQLHLGPLVREAKAVAIISEYNRGVLAPFGADRETPALLVRCGVDPAAYAFRPRTVPVDGPVHAICVATLNELKGHSVLLDALAQGGPELERVTLDLVGSGPLEEPLRAQAARLGLGGRVRFLGTRSEPEVAQLLDEADVFVLASVRTPIGWMDGIPVALMEALACGLPTIASRLSGIPELVRDGETGVLAEPDDPASLAATFERLLADPDATLARAQAGRELIEREFAIERSGDRMAELFGLAPADAAASAAADARA